MIDALPPPAEIASSESYQRVLPTAVRAADDPRSSTTPRFRYSKRAISLEGGRLLLRLLDDPQVAVDPNTLLCTVVDWGVTLPHSQIEQIDRAMGRRFLELYSKAEAQRLSENEEQAWLAILDHIDYQAFSIDRSAPQYVEATVLKASPQIRVEWHDGQTEWLSPEVATSLQLLTPGDRFGAFVKFDRNQKARQIERIRLLGDELPA